MVSVSTINEMDLDGGIACLDFVNSGLHTHKGEIAERLHCYQDLLTLAGRVLLLDKKILGILNSQAIRHPKEAQAVLETALRVRLSMQEIFGSIADRKVQKMDKTALDKFNAFIAGAVSKQAFAVHKGALQLTLIQPEKELVQPLNAFILSAYELLRNKDQQYIKRCGRCQWLFLDETKSHRRKWCSMKDCGSIVKSSRYYKRKKSEQ
jgi:predicted RNA-binding Zn ribbon-like protein